MSSKSRPVEYGGIVWKVVPGSRREQLLLRFIEQDKALHGIVPESVVDDLGGLAMSIAWCCVGFAVGMLIVAVAWWLL